MIDFNDKIKNNLNIFPIFYRFIIENKGYYNNDYIEIKKRNRMIANQSPFYKSITPIK